MPYNTSPKVVVRMERYLSDMMVRRTVRWPSRTPDVLARRIREAFAAAQAHDIYTHYASLRPYYRLKAMKDFVEAEWIGPPTAGGPADEIPRTDMIREGETILPAAKVIDDVVDLSGVVGTAIRFSAEADEIAFPSAVLSPAEKKILYDWCVKDRTWKFIDQLEGGVTLTQRDVDPIYLYNPEDDQ